MPFIKESLDDVQEAQPVPEGEYDLRIVKAEEKESKKGNEMVQVMIVVEDQEYPNAAPINHFLLGWDGVEPDIERMRKLEIKRFCACFDVPTDFEAEDLVGQTGRCFVTQEEGDDGNTYNRLRLPRLK